MLFVFHADFAARAVRFFVNLQGHEIDSVLEVEFSSAKAAVVMILDDGLMFFLQAVEITLAVHGSSLKKACNAPIGGPIDSLEGASSGEAKSGLMIEAKLARERWLG